MYRDLSFCAVSEEVRKRPGEAGVNKAILGDVACHITKDMFRNR